ncbi:MAG: thiamine pyrophosphate-dependent enzyme, partial [Nitrospinota bacterium]|nr:thiamine pyrophosphate-dependent enzyme [Nitrospinota bacterium]
RKPVFLVGRVARRREDWDRRVRLAEILGAAVLTDLKTGATFPTDHRLHFESPGDFVTEGKRALLLKADVILSLDWIDLAGTFKQATGKDEVQGKVIQASVDSYNHNGWSMDHQGLPPADLLLLAEPDVAVARLLPLVEARMTGKSPKWEGGEPSSPAPEGAEGERGIALRDIAQTLERVRGDRDLSIVPVPRSGEGFRFDDPLDCLGLDGGAGLSSGPGLAVGAGLALKGSGRFPVAILGDGNFLQGATALWTAAHYEIPVLYLIENNHSNLNDEIHQETVAKQRGRPPENRWIGVRIDSPPPGLPDIARAQGVAADGPVAKLDDLAAAIEKGLRTVEEGRPYLIDVTVLPRSPRGKYWERG